MVRLVGFVAVSFLVAGRALAAPDPLAAVTLPAVPTFEVPVGAAGTHSVRELLVAGHALRDTEVAVSGYVTWIYDCAADIRRRGESAKRVQKRIENDPTLCERAKFYLGDARDTPPQKSLWVVDVPRPYNKLEVERIKPADRTLANYPDRCESDPRKPRPKFCVPVALGDYVTLQGTFAISSPHAERNSDGLLVFAALAKATPPAPPIMKPVPVPRARTLAPLRVTPVIRQPKTEAARRASMTYGDAATKAYGRRDFARAEEQYRWAVEQWDGNHAAWYGLCGIQLGRGDWAAAQASAAKAFELAPRNPMYAMVHGYVLYEHAIVVAREATARRHQLPIADVQLDLATVDFSRSEQLLRHAVTLDARLWRAHYYLARIARDGGRALDAAQAFTQALRDGPSQPGPWVALVELYRRWQYPEHALQVAEQAVLRAAAEPDVWYVLGMARHDRGDRAASIAAFTRAVELDPLHGNALFQRGQALVADKRPGEAKRDLEAFLSTKNPDPFARQQASRLLLDIAASASAKTSGKR